MDTDYAKGWLWAYTGLRDEKHTPEDIERDLEGSGFVRGKQYATGARAGIIDWEDEQVRKDG